MVPDASLFSAVHNFPDNFAFYPQVLDWKDYIESGDWKQTEVSKIWRPSWLPSYLNENVFRQLVDKS